MATSDLNTHGIVAEIFDLTVGNLLCRAKMTNLLYDFG